MSRRAGTLRLPVDHSTLRVEAANTMLQAWICADSVLAAMLVRLAIVVVMAFQLIAFLAGLALITFRA